ncbi:MAG: RNHCP domain-containing protein [Chloroflexi bacterium]|nr:RNHCP domain-containing protein [Chloroflexota bacterium]MCL5274117.1 RNHCP domain-containing protein [Chloroflexota bacterium]
MKTCFTTQRRHIRFGGPRNAGEDFVCMYCHNIVSVQAPPGSCHNRNHCPRCLSSRHLDLYAAGDRLSACKARMRSIGLTLKRTPRKYATLEQGELMIVHQCEGCGKVSINRIAADDDDEAILSVFEASRRLDSQANAHLIESGIFLLTTNELQLVYRRLYGREWLRQT